MPNHDAGNRLSVMLPSARSCRAFFAVYGLDVAGLAGGLVWPVALVVVRTWDCFAAEGGDGVLYVYRDCSGV